MNVELGGEVEYPGQRVEAQNEALMSALARGVQQGDGVPLRAAEGLLKAADKTGVIISPEVFLEALKNSSIFGTAARAKEYIESTIVGLHDAYTEPRADKYIALPGQLENLLQAFRTLNPELYANTVARITPRQ